MRHKNITIVVSGESGSGKTTIIREIQLALQKAGIKKMTIKTDSVRAPDDLIQGKRLDFIAARVRNGETTIELHETNVNRQAHEDDIPF